MTCDSYSRWILCHVPLRCDGVTDEQRARIQRLKEQGLVRVHEGEQFGRPTKFYVVTDAGVAALADSTRR